MTAFLWGVIMTLKEFLLKNGVKSENIYNHNSDLQIKQSEIVFNLLKEYKNQYSNYMKILSFVSQLDGGLWFECPFEYTEYYK